MNQLLVMDFSFVSIIYVYPAYKWSSADERRT